MRGTSSVPVFCGIDWAEDHYDVALVDDAGVVLARKRISDDSFGYQVLLGLLGEHGDRQDDPIPVAIETPGSAGGVSSAHRAKDLCHQSTVGCSLSRTALGCASQVRPSGCRVVGKHPAHRSERPPALTG